MRYGSLEETTPAGTLVEFNGAIGILLDSPNLIACRFVRILTWRGIRIASCIAWVGFFLEEEP